MHSLRCSRSHSAAVRGLARSVARPSLESAPDREEHVAVGLLEDVAVEAETLVVDDVALHPAGRAVETGDVHAAEVHPPGGDLGVHQAGDVAERDIAPEGVQHRPRPHSVLPHFVERQPGVEERVVATPDAVPEPVAHRRRDGSVVVAEVGGLGTREEALQLDEDAEVVHGGRVHRFAGSVPAPPSAAVDDVAPKPVVDGWWVAAGVRVRLHTVMKPHFLGVSSPREVRVRLHTVMKPHFPAPAHRGRCRFGCIP